jgi:lysozyme
VKVNIERLTASIKHHEGKVLKVYKDSVGVPTIGYGRNLKDVGVSEMEAEIMLQADIYRAIEGAVKVVPSFSTLTDARQEVLVEMAFNLGASRLAGFVKTLQLIEEGDWEGAAAEMLDSRWAEQVGHRAVRLSRKFAQG